MNKTVLVIGIIFLLIGASVVSSTGYIAKESNPSGIYFKMGSPTVLLDENFSGTFPPEGWETGFFNQSNLSCCDSEPPCARGEYPGQGQYYDNFMISKAIDANNYEKCIIKFYFGAQGYYPQYFNVYLKYRRNETSPWIDITPWNNPIDDVCEYYETEITYDPEGCGEALQIIWLYLGYYYFLDTFCIDDVKILGIPINNPPFKPTIDGPTSGEVGEEYCWTISSVDPNGDDVMYIIDWGDGETTETECYPSGEEVEVCHTYYAQGTYNIKAKAKECPDGLESDWAELTVSMPRNRAINGFSLRFLEQFPILQKILSYIL